MARKIEYKNLIQDIEADTLTSLSGESFFSFENVSLLFLGKSLSPGSPVLG